MAEQTPRRGETCPTCAGPVRVHSTDEGTGSYTSLLWEIGVQIGEQLPDFPDKDNVALGMFIAQIRRAYDLGREHAGKETQ